MKINKPIRIICIVLAFIFILISGLFIFEHFQHFMNKDNRDAMLTIYNKSSIGMSTEEFLRIFLENKSFNLNINKYSDEYTISMPVEFGAEDWLMFVYTKDNKITELKIRTLDGPKPDDGPEDKK